LYWENLRGDKAMRSSLIDFVAAATVAAGLTAIPTVVAAQQLQRQDTVVTTATILPPAGVPSPFAAATVRTYTYEPVCTVQRVQFSDEYGWRVRDVRICY
jgi:hypothetical protein